MRYAHLVGSLPGRTADDAVGTAVDILGGHLRTVTDGETGRRRNWGQWIVESFRSHPALLEQRSGAWTGYDDIPRMRVRRGARLAGRDLDLGYARAAADGYPTIDRLRRERQRGDLRFQCGLVSPLDLALITLGTSGLTRQRPFIDATVAQIAAVRARTGAETLFQVEVPIEVVMVARTPGPLRAAATRAAARSVLALARAAPEGTRFAVHLCVGDMRHEAAVVLDDVGVLVALANHLARNWPARNPLELVHVPFAAAARPAPTDPGFYRPLAMLRVGRGTRVAAGFVHESPTMDDLHTVWDLVETGLGREVDLAAACGLGRRPAADAVDVLRRTRALLDARTGGDLRQAAG